LHQTQAVFAVPRHAPHADSDAHGTADVGCGVGDGVGDGVGCGVGTGVGATAAGHVWPDKNRAGNCEMQLRLDGEQKPITLLGACSLHHAHVKAGNEAVLMQALQLDSEKQASPIGAGVGKGVGAGDGAGVGAGDGCGVGAGDGRGVGAGVGAGDGAGVCTTGHAPPVTTRVGKLGEQPLVSAPGWQ
jgi:hypothetical protein